jgi:hypothetical protein
MDGAAVDSPARAHKRIVDNALGRTVFADGERRPDDYEVRHDRRTVCRIYRMRSTGRELRRWTQIGLRALTRGSNGGVADAHRGGQDGVPGGVAASVIGDVSGLICST